MRQWPPTGSSTGDAFRAVVTIRRREGEALGEICMLPRKDPTPWVCHPVALDACFQLVAATRPPSARDDFRLPTGAEEVHLPGPLPDRFWCHARVRGEDAFDKEVLAGDLTLLSEDGTVLGQISGVTFARVATRFLGNGEDVRRWLFDLEWRPTLEEATPASLPASEHVAQRFNNFSARLAKDLELDYYSEQWPAFDRLSLAYIVEALDHLGVDLTPGVSLDADDWASRCGIAPQHRRFWHRLFAVLSEEGIVDRRGVVLHRAPEIPAQKLIEEIRTRFPKAQAELALVERGGSRLAELLRGRVDPLEILFAHGDDDLLERLYRDSTFMRYYNAAIAEAATAAAETVPLDRPLKVLEIGGGTGATTHYVLPALAHRRCEYVFTDIWPLLLSKAQKKFARCDFVDYRVLDIERDPDGQGFTRQRFDLVIAANVLHATANLPETLAHARKLLAPGGWLLLLEGPGPQRWLDMIVGGTDGWWRFRDGVREGYPLLEPEAWARSLREAGFEQPTCIRDPTRQPPQFLIVAQAARMIPASGYGWLIVGDAGDFERGLVSALAARGGEATLCGNAIEASAVLSSPAPGDRPWRVIYTRALYGPSWNDIPYAALPSSEREITFGAVELLQELIRSGCQARLWLVTRNAQPAGTARPLELAQTPLWGVGRVAATEHPEFWGGLVDLDAESDAAEAERLITETLEHSGEDQVAYRDGRRLVARLVRSRTQISASESFRLRPDSAYLITGGLRGIGLAVAEWLIERGARHLILISRTTLPPRGTWRALSSSCPGFAEVQAIRGLELRGADIIFASLDVANEKHFREFLTSYEGEGRPPVRGVIHSAGLIQDQLLLQMQRDNFAAVTHAKIDGAWLLHRLLSESPLDFFVLFSSGTSLLGTFGQANYAAGNAFMDGLAHHRRALGLPATSINWGVWGSIGIVARMEHKEQLAQNGLIEIRPELGLQALELILRRNPAQIAAMPTDWAKWCQIYPRGREKPLFGDLLEEIDAPAFHAGHAESDREWLAILSSGEPRERAQRIQAYLQGIVARVMRLDEADLDVEAPLNTLGLDSIMAMEIRNRVEGECKASVSIVELLQGASVRQLAERVAAASAGTTTRFPDDRDLTKLASQSPGLRIDRQFDRSGKFPCSPAQESLWFLERVNPSHCPVYNVPVAATLKERIDPDILQRALEDVVHRHQPLRTSFKEESGRPWQIVSERINLDFRHEDLSNLPAANQEPNSQELALELARRPFDLEVAPLARFLLLTRRDSSVFVLSIHHLVFDGWSAGVLVSELAEQYEALQNGSSVVVSAPEMSTQTMRCGSARESVALR